MSLQILDGNGNEKAEQALEISPNYPERKVIILLPRDQRNNYLHPFMMSVGSVDFTGGFMFAWVSMILHVVFEGYSGASELVHF